MLTRSWLSAHVHVCRAQSPLTCVATIRHSLRVYVTLDLWCLETDSLVQTARNVTSNKRYMKGNVKCVGARRRTANRAPTRLHVHRARVAESPYTEREVAITETAVPQARAVRRATSRARGWQVLLGRACAAGATMTFYKHHINMQSSERCHMDGWLCRHKEVTSINVRGATRASPPRRWRGLR